MTSTSYGTWANHGGTYTDMQDDITTTLGGIASQYDTRAITADMRAAISGALPDGWGMYGNEFRGPAGLDTFDADDVIRRALESVDFWAIVRNHELSS